ncbi:hypothetical protein H4R33_000377 [Dimargaris cristalligena]|nr:hypothetical protein H4R33_000377 [Dimargaris cristalligena]
MHSYKIITFKLAVPAQAKPSRVVKKTQFKRRACDRTGVVISDQGLRDGQTIYQSSAYDLPSIAQSLPTPPTLVDWFQFDGSAPSVDGLPSKAAPLVPINMSNLDLITKELYNEQFALQIGRLNQLTRPLKSQEDTLYAPGLTRTLVAIFVLNHAHRLIRKLDRQELTPLALNYLLGFAIGVLPHGSLSPIARRNITTAYLERIYYLAMGQFEGDAALDTPYILYLASRLHVFSKTSDKYSFFVALGIRMITQMRYHIVDLPTQITYGPETLVAVLRKEYKRRIFWEITALDSLICCFLGIPGNFREENICVDPIDDRLLGHLLQLAPDDDVFPAIIPALGTTVCGNPVLIRLTHLVYKASNLRAKILPPNSVSDFRPYYELNAHLQTVHRELLQMFPLPRSNKIPSHLTAAQMLQFTGLGMIHSAFTSVVLLLNTHNWSFGARAIRPETDPFLHQMGLRAALQFTDYCLPFLRHLPPQRHHLCASNCCFLAAYRLAIYLGQLKETMAVAPETPLIFNQTLDTIRTYITYLDEYRAYVTYVDSYQALLQQQLYDVGVDVNVARIESTRHTGNQVVEPV